jgi:hypothetical protein
MLGSSLAVILMIRNQRKPLSADFTLNGCSRVFNIFHPYDPVAYRIEPLLDPLKKSCSRLDRTQISNFTFLTYSEQVKDGELNGLTHFENH